MKKHTQILFITALIIIIAAMLMPAMLSGKLSGIFNKALLVLLFLLVSMLITFWIDKGK